MTLPTEIITDHIHAPTTLSLDHHYYHGLCLGWVALSLSLLLLPATAQLRHAAPPPPPSDPFSRLKFDKNTAIIMVILVVVFFLLGFLSIYTRQCAERRLRGRMEMTLPMGLGLSGRRSRGLEAEIIDSFPTLVYSTVKGLKVGRSTLECAVCLNEFQDDETLRLIPKCNHVFHPDCIDMWLGSHSTCPLCRANLIPRPEEREASSVPIQIEGVDSQESETPTPNLMSRSQRSRSRRVGRLFSRSHSTGHSLEDQNWERFTLRLPEEATMELLLNRTNSFTREMSQRQGYRTRSVGVSGATHLQYERWGFTMNLKPPFFSTTSPNPPPQLGLGLGPGPSGPSMDDVSHQSTDPLCPQHKD